MTVTVTRTFPVSPKTMYYMLTNEDGLAYWFADRIYTRPQVGGHVVHTWATGRYVAGVFTELKEDEFISLTWRDAGQDTGSVLSYQLEAVGEGTKVTLTQTGLPSDVNLADYQQRWEDGFNTLYAALTTGEDARITGRILIGIYPDNMDEKAAKRLGLPVNEGLLVANTIPGLGAEKAGLKAGDLVVEANGKPVGNNAPLVGNLTGLKPGDSAPVTFYRGAEKHTVTLTLSGYPLPPSVKNFIELANRVEGEYAKLHEELQGLVAGLSDETTNTPPAEGEWSVNQVLAHLILTERNAQEFLGGYVQAPELHTFSGNANARVNAVVRSYGGTAGLLNELKRAYVENIAILRAFEDEKFDRPYILWWANFQMADITGGHNRTHINQIKDTLAKVTK
ncbi:MAG: SRPBCC domain-containing protein [bacterium]|nr:SRPBCC domain-containing protein [bacterium]